MSSVQQSLYYATRYKSIVDMDAVSSRLTDGSNQHQWFNQACALYRFAARNPEMASKLIVAAAIDHSKRLRLRSDS